MHRIDRADQPPRELGERRVSRRRTGRAALRRLQHLFQRAGVLLDLVRLVGVDARDFRQYTDE